MAFNAQQIPTRLPNGLIQAVTTLTGSADVIPLKAGSVFLAGTVVDAATLAQPIAGSTDAQPNGQDGLVIVIIDTGGHAHTITTIATPIFGIVPSHHLLTFNGTAGSYVMLEAYNGLWYVIGSSGVTAS
jgi:hypothetical protein